MNCELKIVNSNCWEILQLGEDYRILGTIARVERTLGFVENALTHYQTALQLCPEEDVKEKVSTLHNMAYLKAQQGEIEDAIALYQQSLEITDSINNVQTKAATLAGMAYCKGVGWAVSTDSQFSQSTPVTAHRTMWSDFQLASTLDPFTIAPEN